MTVQQLETGLKHRDSEIEVNFTTETTIVHPLIRGADSLMYDGRTGDQCEMYADAIARCKYGEVKAASVIANRMLQAVEHNPHFMAFLQRAQEAKRPVLLTSHGVFNVPTASKVIIDRLAGRLNTMLSDQGLPGVVLDAPVPTRVDEGFFEVDDGTGVLMPRPEQLVVPDTFSGWSVLFVDDMLVRPEHAQEVKKLFLEQGKAEDIHFIYGASLDDPTTSDELEEYVNHKVYSPDLQSLKELVSQPEAFVVVQRLLKSILNPHNIHSLLGFIAEMPEESIKKIYEAATSADFRRRYNGYYMATTGMLQQYLFDRGLVDSRGIFYETKRIMTPESLGAQPHHIYSKILDRKSDVTIDEAIMYSKMKYGDYEATASFARQMAEQILHDEHIRKLVDEGEELILTASAYGEVPTAAAQIADIVEQHLRGAEIPIRRIKIQRGGNLVTQDFGKMTQEQRLKELEARQLSIPEEDQQALLGGTVLVIDDLSATGSHERAIHQLLSQYDIRQAIYAYNIKFGENLMVNEPETEEWLNRVATVGSLDILARDKAANLLVNARLVKFLLGTEAEKHFGKSQQNKKADLTRFAQEADPETIRSLYAAAISEDGYAHMKKYQEGFRILEAHAYQRGIIDTETVNRVNSRIVARNLGVNSEGIFVDVLTGEEQVDLIRSYSKMKFGCAREIERFGRMVADSFFGELERQDSTLRNSFLRAVDSDEHVVLFVPGSRNVQSSSNFVMEKAIERINAALALQGFPTILVMPLSRLSSNDANYAQLSSDERKSRSKATKTMLPGTELYQHGVHVLFADDVRITGATADRVRESALENGAKSFHEVYAIGMDPWTAQESPSIEHELNSGLITGELNEMITDILNQDEFRPVQRMIRLLLDERNREQLFTYLSKEVNNASLKKIFTAVTSNDYLTIEKYAPSGQIVVKALQERGLVDQRGQFI